MVGLCEKGNWARSYSIRKGFYDELMAEFEIKRKKAIVLSGFPAYYQGVPFFIYEMQSALTFLYPTRVTLPSGLVGMLLASIESATGHYVHVEEGKYPASRINYFPNRQVLKLEYLGIGQQSARILFRPSSGPSLAETNAHSVAVLTGRHGSSLADETFSVRLLSAPTDKEQSLVLEVVCAHRQIEACEALGLLVWWYDEQEEAFRVHTIDGPRRIAAPIQRTMAPVQLEDGSTTKQEEGAQTAYRVTLRGMPRSGRYKIALCIFGPSPVRVLEEKIVTSFDDPHGVHSR